MKVREIVSRFMVARSDARYCHDCYVRTGDKIYLEIARVNARLAKQLRREIVSRLPGWRMPK